MEQGLVEEEEVWSRVEEAGWRRQSGEGLSVCGRILAVRGHEDDGLGCHSRRLFLIGCDVPRWTSAQPGSLWLPAPPVRSNANTNGTMSCFQGRAAALLASGVCLSVTWLLLRCLQGLFAGSCTASVCVFLYQEKAPNKSLQNFNVRCQRDRQASPRRIDECLLIIH